MSAEDKFRPSLRLAPSQSKFNCGMWLLLVTFNSAACTGEASDRGAYLRVNQVGYLGDDAKIAIAFSNEPLAGKFELVDQATESPVFAGSIAPSRRPNWGKFLHYYDLDFSSATTPGRYFLRIEQTGTKSSVFSIGNNAYQNYQADLLLFMRQQRCGYNPFLDVTCHQRDGRTAYGPRPEATVIDVAGGWHDAGDQLKYLITSSNATARMLLAYELEPEKFGDVVDERGHPVPNGIPDVLDEAKWGLDWLHKMHPRPDELYHQVADDRDHNGWKWPNEDSSDYGWGPNSYRVVYFADGKPQGLGKFKSEATGIANLAGRYAAAMAMGARIWKEDLKDENFAAKCKQSAVEVYRLGKAAEGYQQGNSYGAPYRYSEDTWADDMEWGAAELYRLTSDKSYLDDAKKYAELIGATSWLPLDTAKHYQYYPFVNVGHFALHPHVDEQFQAQLASYYQAGIEAALERGRSNPFSAGVPFIWCSNNLTVALITQIILYEDLTGDYSYHDFMLAQRDWLFGRNPWGTSMFTGIPRDGEYPEDVHTSVWHLTRKMVPGGLVDGPVFTTVYESLKGLHLTDQDEFAEFQSPHVVYHDDIGDYSTNEPTMDGTAGAILMMAHFGTGHPSAPHFKRSQSYDPAWSLDEGGIVRANRDKKQIALIFTGDTQGEGTESILSTLKTLGVEASFFVTGNFLAQPKHAHLPKRILEEGHYLGPHSHGHLLYSPWKNRKESIVTEEEYKSDLSRNLSELRELGTCRQTPVYFIPPYEWYNEDHVRWARDLGCVLFNFTPGSGSHRDWAPEGHEAFRPSQAILSDILAHEESAPDGLNGHLLLLHLGSKRQDKMHTLLNQLIEHLVARGYELQRVDKLLSAQSSRRAATGAQLEATPRVPAATRQLSEP